MPAVVLKLGDEPRLERLLRAHSDSSVFLRSNLRAVGITYEGQPLQGHWVAEAGPDGELLGVVCHVQNGNLLFQAPAHAAQLAQFERYGPTEGERARAEDAVTTSAGYTRLGCHTAGT